MSGGCVKREKEKIEIRLRERERGGVVKIVDQNAGVRGKRKKKRVIFFFLIIIIKKNPNKLNTKKSF